MTPVRTPSRRRLAAGLAAVALAWATAGAAQAAEPANAESSAPAPGARLEGTALRAALQRGGHVIYFRHTATDFSRSDGALNDYADCANQRLLSAQGRADARAIGERIRGLRLPVGEVFASPMCRTLEHARLSFSAATPAPALREGEGGDYPGLKALLSRPVAPGTNRWLVGHGIPFRAVAGPPHLAEGEAAVIRPRGNGWTVVARIGVADWDGLAAAR